MIKDIDKGYKRIKKDALNMKKIEIQVGLFGEGESPVNNLAYRGVVQELGSVKKNIPKRPFMRTAFDLNERNIKNAIIKWQGWLVEGKINLDKFLDLIAVLHKGQIQEMITLFSWSPNAPQTIKKKNSSQPLIDTGEMRQGIKYKVKK